MVTFPRAYSIKLLAVEHLLSLINKDTLLYILHTLNHKSFLKILTPSQIMVVLQLIIQQQDNVLLMEGVDVFFKQLNNMDQYLVQPSKQQVVTLLQSCTVTMIRNHLIQYLGKVGTDVQVDATSHTLLEIGIKHPVHLTVVIKELNSLLQNKTSSMDLHLV